MPVSKERSQEDRKRAGHRQKTHGLQGLPEVVAGNVGTDLLLSAIARVHHSRNYGATASDGNQGCPAVCRRLHRVVRESVLRHLLPTGSLSRLDLKIGSESSSLRGCQHQFCLT